jgi:WD40 repeat protein
LANDVTGAIRSPTLQELSKQLTNAKKPYTLLHFISHGKLMAHGETLLYWAQADNQVLPVTGEDLIGELKNIGNYQRSLPHFAFLCTCESADPRAEGALGGLAQRLVRNLGMPAVIAMTRKVSVETGLALGQSFYRRLRESGEVDTALQEATAGLSKRHDITVPALFSRLGGRPLFSDRLDDRDLTDEEIEYGIEKLRQLLQERAPHASVLKQRFETQVKTLKDTRGAESRTAREQRQQAIVELNNLCEQVIELSFDALAALGKQPPEYKAECPFPGLSSFGDKKYHKFFFGRDELIRDLQKELAKDNFLAVIGTSGSGKSSVVLAGLIPKLKEEELSLQWAYMTPGKEPLRQLKRRLEKLLKVSEHHSTLVVDQFEELFTLCEDKAERVEFIEKLLNFADRRKVVITMRADFLGECTFYPELRKRIETRQKLVGPMEPAELITAMKMQADRGGLRFEAGLSHAILNDVQGEPGAMPLLQYALQELWKRRRGRWLCDEEYQAIGKVQKAIAKTADDFYNKLSVAEQEQVQNIFLRLTRLDASAVPGEKRRDRRRRVELEDLVPTGDDLAVTRKLVQQLAGEGVRLVVTSRNEATGKEEVEVAHEALIRYWPTLQNWLNQNRNNLLLRETINQAAQEWQQHQQQPDKDIYLIHQGGRLEDAEVLSKHPKFVQLNQLEAEYVLACVELGERRRKLEEQRKQRQLMAAAISAFILGGFAIFAGIKWREAEMERIQALLQSAEMGLVTHQTLDARIGSLRAGKELKQSFWQGRLPYAGLKDQVFGKLTSTIYAGQEINRLTIDQGTVTSVAISPDGRLATGDDEGNVRLWDTKTQKWEILPKSNYSGNTYEGTSVAFSPNGQFLAISRRSQGSRGGVYLWNTKTKQSDKLRESDSGAYEVVFSPDSKFLVSTSSIDGTAKLWDTKTKTVTKFQPRQKEVTRVTLSPDGQLLATIRDDRTVYLEDAKTKKPDKLVKENGSQKEVFKVAFSPNSQLLTTIAVGDHGKSNILLWNTKAKKVVPEFAEFAQNLAQNQGEVDSVAFSPDSQLLTAITKDGNIWLFDIKGRVLAKLQGHQGEVYSVAFSPDSQSLVTSGNDRTVRLWDISDRQLPIIRTEEPATKMAFSSDGQRLATLGTGGIIQLWNTKGKDLPLLKKHQDRANDVAFSPDGQLLTATTTDDGIIRLWDAKYNPLVTLSGHQAGPKVAISPDGQELAVGKNDGSVWLGDINKKQPISVKLKGNQGQEQEVIVRVAISPDGQHLAVGGNQGSVWLGDKDQMLLKLNAKDVSSMAFSPDSQLLVTGREDGTIQLWDNKGQHFEDKIPKHQGGVLSVAFSPDGKSLATGGSDGTTRVWSIKGQELAKFQGHQDMVRSVVFSPDGKLLATSGEDRIVRLYQIGGGLDELLEMNCDWVRDYLNNPDGALSSDRQLCDGISTASSSPKK